MTLKSWSPLLSVNDHNEILQNSPFNICVELQFLLLLLLCIYDAFVIQKDKFHRIALLSGFIGSLLVIPFVVLHPQIGNIYFAQFTFMSFDHRVPIIAIIGSITWFTHISVTFPWKMSFNSILAEYAFTNLLMAFLWEPFEIMSTHFMFWSWHNDDPLVRDRYGKVPIAGTMWMMSWISGFQFILSLYRWYYSSPRLQVKLLNSTQIGHIRCIWIALNVAIGGTIWGNIPFNFWFHPLNNYMGWHSSKSLHLWQALCALIVVMVIITNLSKTRLRYHRKQLYFRMGLMVLIIYGYGSTALMAQYEDIGNSGYRSISYHQTLGERKGMEWSYWKRYQRRRNVVGYKIDGEMENYDFQCMDYGKEIAPMLEENGWKLEWYPLCITGLEEQFVKQFFILLFVGMLLAVVSQTVVIESEPKTKEKEL